MFAPLPSDVKYGLRSLVRNPGFTLTVLLTLSFAIAANTAMFTVVDAALLRPLPYGGADRIVSILEQRGGGDNAGVRPASFPTFIDWQQQSTSFTGMAYVRGLPGVLAGEAGPDRVLVGYPTAGFFGILGARPVLGRAFIAEEEQRGGRSNVVVLSHTLWQRRFGGDRTIVGRTVVLDSTPVTVVGVMPVGVSYPEWADLWRPIDAIMLTDAALQKRNQHADSRIIARMRGPATIQTAMTELSTIQAQLARAYPTGTGAAARPSAWDRVKLTLLRDEIIGASGSPLLFLTAAALLVFLIACANVASLAAIRATVRERELAIRAAMGASRARIARQLVVEGLILGVSSAIIGSIAATWIVRLVRAGAPPGLPRVAELRVDSGVLAFTMALALLAAVLVGLVPSLRLAGGKLSESLRDGRQAGTGGARGARMRRFLTSAEIGLATALLIGASLLIRSFQKFQAVDLGINADRVVGFHIFPPAGQYDQPEQAAALYRRIIAEVAAIPGVSSAAVVSHAPLTGGAAGTRVIAAGSAVPQDQDGGALYKTVSTDYLRTMQLPLRRGRWFTDADMDGSGAGVVISEQLAKRNWPGQDPIGRSITVFRASQARPDFGKPVVLSVIGVVQDVRNFGFAADPNPDVYVPYTLEVWPHLWLVARTNLDEQSVIPAIRRVVQGIDRNIPVSGSASSMGFLPMNFFISQSLSSRRFSTAIAIGFAAAALLLAVIGIYGATAYGVAQRTNEFGIRMALGAAPNSILTLVLGQSVRIAGAGAIVGVVVAFASTRLIRKMLFGTSPTDPATFVLVPLLLLTAVVVACVLPARRAAALDPTRAIRME